MARGEPSVDSAAGGRLPFIRPRSSGFLGTYQSESNFGAGWLILALTLLTAAHRNEPLSVNLPATKPKPYCDWSTEPRGRDDRGATIMVYQEWCYEKPAEEIGH